MAGSIVDIIVPRIVDELVPKVTEPIFFPTDLPGLDFWYDITNFASLTIDGANRVSQVNDLSGNGFHAQQGNTTFMPVYNATGLNGRPTLQGDADAIMTMSNYDTGPLIMSTFCVLQTPATIAAENIFGALQSQRRTYLLTSISAGDDRFIYGDGAFEEKGTIELTTNTAYIIEYLMGASTVEGKQNGATDITETKSLGSNQTTAWELFNAAIVLGDSFRGRISSLFSYNRLLSLMEINQVVRYLNREFGVF